MPVILPKDLAVAPPRISLYAYAYAYAMLAPNQKKNKKQKRGEKAAQNRYAILERV